MPLQKQQIAIDKLTVGMYVCELDRPWIETPFLMQGFVIESSADIAALAEHCQFVFIDVAYRADNTLSLHSAQSPKLSEKASIIQSRISSKSRPKYADSKVNKARRVGKTADIIQLRGQRQYNDSVTWRQELQVAKKAVEGLTETVKELFDALKADGSFQFSKLKQSVSPLVSSIERNPDACIWLARLKSQSDYIYKHSVACSIWAVALGRELGLPAQDLKSLALGALLLDVGMLQLPRELLEKITPLSQAEFTAIRSHVGFSLEEVEKSQLTNQDVWDMVAYHHERYDGAGYPDGLAGEDIPLFARIAGIVDTYDAMTSARIYQKPVSPSQAIKDLYKDRDVKFEASLVEEFIQAIGLYPAGTMVLLSTGEVAIVIAEGRTRRLKPQVLLLLDKNKKSLEDTQTIDLVDAVCPITNEPIDIVHSLEPGAFGVNPENIAFQPA